MSKNRNRTRRIYGIILTSFIIIWIGSVSLQMLSNRHNAWIASEMILQQLEDVIEENKESYQTLLETLKEEYTLRAETVANLLEMEGRAISDHRGVPQDRKTAACGRNSHYQYGRLYRGRNKSGVFWLQLFFRRTNGIF